jgi:multidrug efflux pump subunit AcrB
MAVYPERGVNTLALTQKVKKVMREIEAEYPANFTSLLRRDSSKDIMVELNKIFIRTALSTLILLIFVFLVSRSWRYLGIMMLTLLANVLISFIFFYLCKVDIHIYSMAGVTVSLGMVIDASIMMIDHYGYYRNKKVFLSIVAALLTTVGALIVVFFLPENTKLMLIDFSIVIIISLCVSLGIAWFFVPVLVDRYPIRKSNLLLSKRAKKRLFKRRKRLVVWSRFYERLISFLRRWRWVLIVASIFGFGLPIQFMPSVLKDQKGNQWTEGWKGLYNKTIGGSWYQSKGKPVIEPMLGGTLRLFTKNSNRFGFRDPSRLSIGIRATMPEGSTVEQMNDVMKGMENYLSQYNQIDMFETNVQARSANMTVTFKKEYEHSAFPLQLKQEIIYRATNAGAANWSVSGIDDQYFSNMINSGAYYGYQILFSGYNYDKLYELASACAARLEENRRITKTLVYSASSDSYYTGESNTEFYIDYNQELIAYNKWSLYDYYAFLQQQLLDVGVATLYENGSGINIKLVSAQKEDFDAWHIENDLLDVNGRLMKLSQLGTIEKRRTGNNIYKEDQQYILRLGFDFIGTSTLANRVLENELEYLKTILPVGYKAERPSYGGWWNASDSKQYWLLFLIILVIYFMCAILFESLLQPFVVISLIPLSFIGVFLTFNLSGFYFDQGGFASMILLCGIVVNAGIYFLNEYNLITRGKPDVSGTVLQSVLVDRKRAIKAYAKAYHHKIIPISLTILSTILGLIPFLMEGPKEVFWFSFAVGAMGGMLFSFVALFIYLPAFLPLGLSKHKRKI